MDFSSLPPDERQRILAKLAKLKALSECKTGNVNETAVAAAAMTRLMAEYRIEVAELVVESPGTVLEEDVLDQVRGKSFPNWQAHLLNQLARANECVGFEHCEHSWEPYFGRRQAVRLRLLGRGEDIAHTRMLYLFCVDEINRLCHDWSPRAPVARKNDFRRGAAVAVGQRALDEREAVRAEERARVGAGQESRALAVLDRRLDEVHQAARQRGLRVTRQSSRPLAAGAYAAGYQAGVALNLPGKGQPLRLAGDG